VIDDATIEEKVASVTWYKNDRPISPGSEVNVVLGPGNRTITITDTLRGTPAQVGAEGNYSCEVCIADNPNCKTVDTCVDVCSKYY